MNIRTAAAARTRFARLAAAALAAGTLAVAAPALAGTAGAAVAGLGPGPYVETGSAGSHWRAAPSLSAYVVKEFGAGVKVNVDCRTRGDFVRLPGGKGFTNVWYRFAYPVDGGRMYASAAEVRVVSPELPYDCAGKALG